MTPDKHCRQVKVSSFFLLYTSKQTMVPRNNGCCFRLWATAQVRDKQKLPSTLLSTYTRVHRHACVIPTTKALKPGRHKAGKKGQTLRLSWHLRHAHPQDDLGYSLKIILRRWRCENNLFVCLCVWEGCVRVCVCLCYCVCVCMCTCTWVRGTGGG